jgi:hypothetical protein
VKSYSLDNSEQWWVSVPAYKQFWTDKRLSLKTQYQDIDNKYPDAAPTMQQLLKVLCGMRT